MRTPQQRIPRASFMPLKPEDVQYRLTMREQESAQRFLRVNIWGCTERSLSEIITITSTRAFETIFKISYEIIGEPKISIIIPNKDHIDDLKRCMESIEQKSTYKNYEYIIVENNSTDSATFEYYKKLEA